MLILAGGVLLALVIGGVARSAARAPAEIAAIASETSTPIPGGVWIVVAVVLGIAGVAAWAASTA